MKNFIISKIFICFWIVFLALNLNCKGQDNFKWEEVVKVDSNITAQELYSHGKIFIAKTFVSNKAVTQLNDDISSTIIIKAAYLAPVVPNYGKGFTDADAGYVEFTLTIACKNGRYKYTIDQCHHTGNSQFGNNGNLTNDKPELGVFSGGLPKKYWADTLKPSFISYINSFISDLKKNMAGKSDKSDW